MLPMTVFKYKITGALRRSGAHLKVCITKEWVHWWVHFTSSCPPIVYYVTSVNLYTLHAQIIPLAEFLNSLFLPRCPVSPENMIQAYFLHSERPVNHHQRLAVEQYELSFGFTGTSSGNCQETETCIIRACHTPRQPLQNHPSGHLGRWATLWSAEEMLHGQHQRVDIPAHARTAHNGFLQKRLEEDLYWIVPHVPPTTQSVRGLDWSELNY